MLRLGAIAVVLTAVLFAALRLLPLAPHMRFRQRKRPFIRASVYEWDRTSASGSAYQFPVDRNWVPEEVKDRAVSVNCCGQFFVSSWGFRST